MKIQVLLVWRFCSALVFTPFIKLIEIAFFKNKKKLHISLEFHCYMYISIKDTWHLKKPQFR
jgi:hypothetical protein